MKKNVFLKNAKLLSLFLMICSFFIGCSNIISTSNDSSDSSSIASVSEIERLALIALSENYTTSVSEMEKNLIDFISDNSSDSNDSSRSANSKSYTISLLKQDSVPVLFSQTQDSGYPIPIRGGTGKYIDNGKEKSAGHYWVIDGYARYYCSYYEGDKDNIIGNMTADYVHVNWGWRGSKNGYYLSGVFDSHYLPFVTSEKDVYSASRNCSANDEVSSNEKGYYQYGLRMIPNLHPNR